MDGEGGLQRARPTDPTKRAERIEGSVAEERGPTGVPPSGGTPLGEPSGVVPRKAERPAHGRGGGGGAGPAHDGVCGSITTHTSTKGKSFWLTATRLAIIIRTSSVAFNGHQIETGF